MYSDEVKGEFSGRRNSIKQGIARKDSMFGEVRSMD